jgi:ADP-ribose pyrophosphatase YjhB (NUDIX family)
MPGSDDCPFPFDRRVPDGDTRERLVCRDCGFIHYQNPTIVVGVVASCAGRVLLCRRAIEPRVGFWTIPAGFLEEGETPEEGAAREAREEANADLDIDALLGVYSVGRISQVHLLYRARLRSPDVSPGAESIDVALVPLAEIPWSDLAFPSVRWALERYGEVGDRIGFEPFRYGLSSRGG